MISAEVSLLDYEGKALGRRIDDKLHQFVALRDCERAPDLPLDRIILDNCIAALPDGLRPPNQLRQVYLLATQS